MYGVRLIIVLILMIPVYAFLIWAYLDPRDAYLFGRRWHYREEPELSECAIKLHKIAAVSTMIFITFLIARTLYQYFS